MSSTIARWAGRNERELMINVSRWKWGWRNVSTLGDEWSGEIMEFMLLQHDSNRQRSHSNLDVLTCYLSSDLPSIDTWCHLHKNRATEPNLRKIALPWTTSSVELNNLQHFEQPIWSNTDNHNHGKLCSRSARPSTQANAIRQRYSRNKLWSAGQQYLRMGGHAYDEWWLQILWWWIFQGKTELSIRLSHDAAQNEVWNTNISSKQ